MLKKLTCIMLALGVVSMTACGSGSQSGQTAGTEKTEAAGKTEAAAKTEADGKGETGGKSEKSGEPVKIAFWHNWGSGTSGESIKQSIELYNSSQDKVIVEPLYVPAEGGDSITSKMITAIASGNPPEVVFSSRYGIAEFMDSVTTLSDLIERDNVDMDALYPWAVEEASYEGQVLGMPYDGTSRALFYNKDHFREAGLDPENPPATLEELEECAMKLTKKDGDRITQYGFVPSLGQGWLYTWGWSFGGEFYDPETGLVTANAPEIVDALTWETEFTKKLGAGDVMSFATAAGADANDPFVLGQVSMVVQGNWMTATLDEYAPNIDYGICNIPGLDGVEPTTFVGGRALVIPKGIEGEKLEAAWDFVKWMCTSKEAQEIKLVSREYPVVRSVCEDIYKDDEVMQKFLEVLPNGKCRPVILAGNMMWDELAKAPDRTLQGEDPAAVLTEITDKINKEIETKKNK